MKKHIVKITMPMLTLGVGMHAGAQTIEKIETWHKNPDPIEHHALIISVKKIFQANSKVLAEPVQGGYRNTGLSGFNPGDMDTRVIQDSPLAQPFFLTQFFYSCNNSICNFPVRFRTH